MNMQRQQFFIRSIAGTAYRATITPNGDMTWDTRCERYVCGSWHTIPAYDAFALTEGAAMAQVNIIWGMLEIASAVNKELRRA